MYRPNTTGMLSRADAKNEFAERSYSDPVEVACAVVFLKTMIVKTTVRSDSSATRGNAEELTAQAKVLFSPSTDVKMNDKFEKDGVALRVVGVQPRRAVTGKLDHIEVDMEAWQG